MTRRAGKPLPFEFPSNATTRLDTLNIVRNAGGLTWMIGEAVLQGAHDLIEFNGHAVLSARFSVFSPTHSTPNLGNPGEERLPISP